MNDTHGGRRTTIRRPRPAQSQPPSGSTPRTEALSDGVFAIAMTLLVLDLRPPSHHPGALLHGLLEQWPAYASFLASFLYISVIWTNHHATFREIDAADRAVTWSNLGILGGTVLLPFPTAVLADAFRDGNRTDEQTAAILYALLAVCMSAAWLALFVQLHRRSYPAPASADIAPWREQMRRPIFGSIGYACGALLGVVLTPTVSLIIFVLIPLYYALTSEGLRSVPDA